MKDPHELTSAFGENNSHPKRQNCPNSLLLSFWALQPSLATDSIPPMMPMPPDQVQYAKVKQWK